MGTYREMTKKEKEIRISEESAHIVAEIFGHVLSSSAKDLSLPVVDLMRNALDEIESQLSSDQ